MDVLDNENNKRIMTGNLPAEELQYAEDDIHYQIDFKMNGSSAIRVFRQYPELLYCLIKAFNHRVKEIDMLQRPELYMTEINYLVNAKCSEDYMVFDGSLKDAAFLNPVVTDLDKALWYGAYSYYMEKKINPGNADYDPIEMMSAWIYFLHCAQKNELSSNQTINLSSLSPETPLIDYFEGSIANDKIGYCLISLSSKETVQLKKLSLERIALQEKIKAEQDTGKEIAIKTDREWKVFLQIINALSKQESNVIRRINEATSPKEKLRAINDYDYIINGIKKGRYTLDGKEIQLLPIYESVNERMQKATFYATAKAQDGRPFIVHPALFMLAMNPETYNYFFISFHHLRLSPSKDVAEKFVSLALVCIKRNLGGNEQNWETIDGMIKDFHDTVLSFFQANKSAIDRLSFSRIQSNGISVIGFPQGIPVSSDLHYDEMGKKVKELIQSGAYERELEKIFDDDATIREHAEILKQANEAESEYERTENEAKARQIIISLNIIYMFCDALRIILNSRYGIIKDKYKDQVQQYRRNLLKVDDDLIHHVYSHLDDKELSMLEYRENHGIIYSSMSEQETQEEQYRNVLFSDILKGLIDRLIVGLENQNPEAILKTKAQIRQEIFRFPDCDEKEQYATWLDMISTRISNALIKKCKAQIDSFQDIKDNILSSLGEKSCILPSSAIDSLTTAEMLYFRYASEEYARNGFDFSCISALYYQAFEDAYNELIWRAYADYLNSLEIQGQKYTDVLYTHKKKRFVDPAFMGYLDDDSYNRKYYVTYGNAMNPSASVNIQCMYKSFAIIMKSIRNPSNLNGFCEFFGRLVGFSCKDEMFADAEFMQKCAEFADAIEHSADNRNNASHGGSLIDISQCMIDKKIVLNGLEEVRASSIGLIQKLLYIIKRT